MNVWHVLTNHDANVLVELAHSLVLSAANGKDIDGVITVIKNDGSSEKFSYSLTRIEG